MLMTVVTLAAQTPLYDDDERFVTYEAMQTDYGYFGTTDAIFSRSETIICTFSLTQNKPKDDKIFPTMLSIWLDANALSTKSQELVIKHIAEAGTRMPDGRFRHPATLLLDNNEQVKMDFSINNLTEDYSRYTVMLTAPIAPPDTRRSTLRYGELATKLRRNNIVSISIAGTTLNLSLLGFRSADYINGICQNRFGQRQVLCQKIQGETDPFHRRFPNYVICFQFFKCLISLIGRHLDSQKSIRTSVPQQTDRSDPPSDSPLDERHLIGTGIFSLQQIPTEVFVREVIIFPRAAFVMDQQNAVGI